jgi:hypothetical protein
MRRSVKGWSLRCGWWIWYGGAVRKVKAGKGSLHIHHQGCDFGELTLEGQEGGHRVCLVAV